MKNTSVMSQNNVGLWQEFICFGQNKQRNIKNSDEWKGHSVS